MRKFLIIAFLFTSCTHNPPNKEKKRSIANFDSEVRFDLKLSQDLIFANGANFANLFIKLFDAEGRTLSPPASEIKILINHGAKVTKGEKEDVGLVAQITPKVKSENIKILVAWQEHKSQSLTLKTTVAPLKNKLVPIKSEFKQSSYINNDYYTRQENFPLGQYEGFSLNNTGNNNIVSVDESERNFSFDFPEQARQNTSLMVTDSPNGMSSHMMLSHFMFFPRLNLPFIEYKNGLKVVTLSTGETLTFNEQNEVVSGVFEEGPIDTGPDRFKRKYADLKYKGKGIVLRANARGQMPQQGQFENTQIDIEFGTKFSTDVLIINGTTGQRCRRPKTDFWPSGNSEILFKFSSDEELNKYLFEKCHFEIPSLTTISSVKFHPDADRASDDIWNNCKEENDLEFCIELEVELIDEELKNQVNHKLKQRLGNKRLELEVQLQNDIQTIKQTLLANKAWPVNIHKSSLSGRCSNYSLSLAKESTRKLLSEELLKQKLSQVCSDVIDVFNKKAQADVEALSPELTRNFSWTNSYGPDVSSHDCKSHCSSKLSIKEFRNMSEIYTPFVNQACQKAIESEAYQKRELDSKAGVQIKKSNQ